MGPLISCFMYDEWPVFEYLHVFEGDANRGGKRGSFRELPLSTKSVCNKCGVMHLQT